MGTARDAALERGLFICCEIPPRSSLMHSLLQEEGEQLRALLILTGDVPYIETESFGCLLQDLGSKRSGDGLLVISDGPLNSPTI